MKQIFGCIFFFLFVGCPISAYSELPLRLVALDIGEGQAVLIAQGDEGVLVDTGPIEESHNLFEKLTHYGVSSITDVVLTHLHPDHAGALFPLLDRFPDIHVYETGHRTDAIVEGSTYHNLVHRFDTSGIAVTLWKAKDTLEWKNARLRVLWPHDVPSAEMVNTNSLVLHVQLGGIQLLIMGDVPKEVEEKLLLGNELPNVVDVLIVGHHGAKDASGEVFLSAIKPTVAVVSTNDKNQNGYPDENVIQRLAHYAEKVHLTFRDGDYYCHTSKGSSSNEKNTLCPGVEE